METVIWRRISNNGLEYCEIEQEPVTRLKGHVVTLMDDIPMSVSYHVLCTHDESTQSVIVYSHINGQQRTVVLNRFEDCWFHDDGAELPQLRGCLDIDLGITPSTNTLPIRRLGLSVGQSKQIVAAWLQFPSLELSPLEQQYTRLDMNTYLYESIKSGYRAKIEFDSNGIVNSYESEWERVKRPCR